MWFRTDIGMINSAGIAGFRVEHHPDTYQLGRTPDGDYVCLVFMDFIGLPLSESPIMTMLVPGAGHAFLQLLENHIRGGPAVVHMDELRTHFAMGVHDATWGEGGRPIPSLASNECDRRRMGMWLRRHAHTDLVRLRGGIYAIRLCDIPYRIRLRHLKTGLIFTQTFMPPITTIGLQEILSVTKWDAIKLREAILEGWDQDHEDVCAVQ